MTEDRCMWHQQGQRMLSCMHLSSITTCIYHKQGLNIMHWLYGGAWLALSHPACRHKICNSQAIEDQDGCCIWQGGGS
eukprot:1155245-Pelagomonas_calceolata.AAC.4